MDETLNVLVDDRSTRSSSSNGRGEVEMGDKNELLNHATSPCRQWATD